jgi:hypothetical protein
MSRRRSALLGLAFLTFHAAAAGAQSASPWTGIAADEARRSTAWMGSGGSEMGNRSMSADGRFVVFNSNLDNLVAGDTNNTSDVFLRDRQTGVLHRVSVASDGTQGNQVSGFQTISANGRHIAFYSCATNFDATDTNNACDLFIHDRELGTTVRASFGPSGEQAMATTQHHFALSADGRYFVFNAGFGSYARQVWLRDRDTDGNGVFDEPGTAITTLASLPDVGMNGFEDEEVAISHDGRWIAYTAATWDQGVSWAGFRLYLYDRIATTTVRVDLALGGGPEPVAYTSGPDFSESGHLAYSSNADNLVQGDSDAGDDIFVYDIATGVNTAVELSHAGAPALDGKWAPAMSADGRLVAFMGAEWTWDYFYNVFVVDRQTGLSYDISVRPDGSRDNNAGTPSISADGSAIAFTAGPEMLVNNWGNNGVFVVTGVAMTPSEITVPGAGGTFTLDVTVPAGVAWSLNTTGAGGAEFSQTAGVGPGTVDVTIWGNYDGQEREFWIVLGSEAVVLRQGSAPFINFVYPSQGPMTGGTPIEIFGNGFMAGATVTIGGVPATSVVVVDNGRITATTPANPKGVAELTVTNPNGDSYDYYFFYVDDTPPVVTYEISGTPGQNGWYTSDVSVLWNYEDPESTVFLLNCMNPYQAVIDRLDYASCHVMSEGGDTLVHVEVNRDTVAPIIAIAPSESATYFRGQVVPIAHACTDATSGIDTCTANQTGTHLDTSTVGTFAFSVTAVDRAGLSTTTSTSYTVKIKPEMTVPVADGVYGGTATLRATVTAVGSGAPLAGKTIAFFVDNVAVGSAITSGTGEAVLTMPLETRNAGSHPLHAELAGDDTTLPAMSPGNLIIAKATPVLTWANPAPITHGAPLGSAQLNATASVAGAFAYTPGFSTVLPAGTHTLTAQFTPQDSVNYDTASKTVTLKVKAVPVITWANPAAITYPTGLTGSQLNATANVAGSFVYTPAWGAWLNAGMQTISVTFTPSNTTDYVSTTATVTIEVLKGTVTFSWPPFDPIMHGTPLSSAQLNASASAISGSGTLTYDPPAGTILNAGTHTLTAIFTPNEPANYHPATTTRSLLVGKRYPAVYWQGDLKPIVYGTPIGAAQLYATSPVPGTFAYDPPAGTILNAGLRVIRATFTPDDSVNYHTVTHQKEIVVDKQTTTVTWSNPGSIVYGTQLGAAQLNATASVPGTFSYTPAPGAVLAAGTHSLYVYFTPTDAVNYYGSNHYATIVVTKATPVIAWNNPAPIIYGAPLGTMQLSPKANVAGTYTFDPPAGTVLNAGAGQTLTATFNPSSSNYNPISASVTIDVLTATPAITWGAVGSLTYGTALGASELDATANVPGTFAYTPAAGTVLPGGSHTLSATFTPDSPNYATVNQTQTVTVIKVMPVVTWPSPAAITYGTALTAAQLNASANVAGSFAYTPAPGTILDAGSRTLSVTFTPDEPSNYHSVTTSVPIDVGKATPIVTWPTPAPIVYPTPLSATQLNATANTAGTFAYAPVAGSVFVGGSHAIGVTFTPLDTSNYTNAVKFVTIEVIKATPVLSWPTPASITYGTGLAAQLNPTANTPGTFAFSPGFGTVLGAGTHTLTATFTPHDAAAYTTATISVTLVVTKAMPVVSWTTPASIGYGSALGAAQLNATASVPGSFAYAPAAGTVLGAGTHSLSATFTPTDSANYASAPTSTSVVVAPAVLTVRADNSAKVYGQALPAFTASGTGFVNGDSLAALGGTLTFATSATATSAPGTYPVTPGGVSSPNYSITFAAGTLTVSKAATTLVLTTTPNPSNNNQTVQLRAVVTATAPGGGTPTGTIQFRRNGTLLGTATLVNGVATLNKSFKRGTHSLTATFAGNANFTGSSGAVTHNTQ